LGCSATGGGGGGGRREEEEEESIIYSYYIRQAYVASCVLTQSSDCKQGNYISTHYCCQNNNSEKLLCTNPKKGQVCCTLYAVSVEVWKKLLLMKTQL